ncbi:MAG: glycoside hydrolase family 18 protein [Candidatus Binataceae bacterium]
MNRCVQNFNRIAAGRISFAAILAGIFVSMLLCPPSARAGAIASVDYALVRQRKRNFESTITITNPSSSVAITDWQLAISFPYAIRNIRGAKIKSKSNGTYLIEGDRRDTAVAAGGSVSFRLTAANKTGAAPANPSGCTVNGEPVTSTTCTRGGTSGGGDFAGRVFAPYVDVTLSPTFQLANSAPSVSKFYTLAFIVDGGGCVAEWGTVIPLSTPGFLTADIASLRALGGDVIVSFGGEAGSELAETCTTESALQTQYQSVITQYGLKRIDFDIEGAAIADTSAIALRDQAIAALQRANPNLQVSFTLPVMPYGLTQDGINVVQDAINNGVNLTAVNVMAMDYGSPDSQMGQDAVNAAVATVSQIGVLYPSKSTAELDAMIGVTPMIGVNDVGGETFTLADAQLLENYAVDNGFGLLSFWSATRDQECAGGTQTYASDDCSGVIQTQFQYSGIFNQFNP